MTANPYVELRDEFQRAYATYGENPFRLFIAAGDWIDSGDSESMRPEWKVGFAGLPFMCDDGTVDFGSPHCIYASPWDAADDSRLSPGSAEGDERSSETALKLFSRLAASAGAALPARVRDEIAPTLVEDMETGNDPHRPSNALSWWLVFLWWQIDRALFAHECQDRLKERPNYYVLDEAGRPIIQTWFVNWDNPFLASASAIDRCGLMDLTQSPAEMPLRELMPYGQAKWSRKFRASHWADNEDDEESDGCWFDGEPDHDSPYKFGPIEGTLLQLCEWLVIDRRTLKKYNGRSGNYVRQLHKRHYALWLKSQDRYAVISKKADDEKAQNGAK